jgi:hypothetical protein
MRGVAPPFIVLSLPRSRSAWASRFLSYWPFRAGHDLSIECTNANDFVRSLRTAYDGTAETAAMVGWDAIQYHFPTAKIAVILRPFAEVIASLQKFGLNPDIAEMRRRADMLVDIAKRPGVLLVTFNGLRNRNVRNALFTHCLDTAPDDHWDAMFADWNIQIDMRERLERLQTNQQHIDALKADVSRYLNSRAVKAPKGIAFAIERWPSVWPECDALGADHFREVDGGVELKRGYGLRADLMEAMDKAGTLVIATARSGGRLVGYCTWSLAPDVESAGLTAGEQGAWYVDPGIPNVGGRLYLFALRHLKSLGVDIVYPHRRTQGRGGENLDKFFRRLGAKEIQRDFSLWIGN